MKVVKKTKTKTRTAGCLQLCKKQEAVSETAMCEICQIFAHAMCEIFNDCYVTKAALLEMLKKYSIPSIEKYCVTILFIYVQNQLHLQMPRNTSKIINHK